MKNLIIYKILCLIMLLISLLPRRSARFIADILALLWFDIDTRHRNIALDNLRHAFGKELSEPELHAVAKKIFNNTAFMLFEIGWSYRYTKSDVSRILSIEGLEHIKTACSRGKGVLSLSCHLGNWELLVSGIAITGYSPYAIYRKLDFPPLEKLMLAMRQKHGTCMIPLRGASSKVDEILASGGIVGTLLDQNVDWYKGVFVDFFGRPACTNSGFAKLVLRTRASVVPTCIVRDGKRHIIRFMPEIPLVLTGDRIKDIEINTQNYVSSIESMVRQYPEQWFWVHNRWKTKNYSLLSQKPDAVV
ncbi:Lipid A biosynthesis acyltransferase [Desulfamplus magnetovallimortis]|uniref:Lipid A biosynthesis acyltransferase n=1 Tax=Desulfamplus magnetovallimortis TaxID=1246637 RepID=A0A1W1H8I7_9BACT|nr:lysophospholipid acyltransferase family protein [Desulfamplus magnetovallimortis]SLM28746.1 Lipid A biosynthesis acyltransferase [Desulfamplus magnetovallimortis]